MTITTLPALTPLLLRRSLSSSFTLHLWSCSLEQFSLTTKLLPCSIRVRTHFHLSSFIPPSLYVLISNHHRGRPYNTDLRDSVHVFSSLSCGSPLRSRWSLGGTAVHAISADLSSTFQVDFSPSPFSTSSSGRQCYLAATSLATASRPGSHSDFSQSCRKFIPEKDLARLPTYIFPDHNRDLYWLVNRSPPLSRRESWILPERGCGLLVLLSL